MELQDASTPLEDVPEMAGTADLVDAETSSGAGGEGPPTLQDATAEDGDDPLTDEELESCVDDMRQVYLSRPSNRRVKRLLRESLAQVTSARREHLPAGQLRDGRVIAVFGEARAGKSALVQRLLANCAMLATPADTTSKPLVDIQVKGPATLSSVGLQILQHLGYESDVNLNEAQVWRRTYALLKKRNVLAIHLGEFANVSGTANVLEKTKLRNTIKSVIINELHPMVLILSGLPEIVRFLCEDEQIRERAAFVGLERLQPEDDGTVAEGVRQITAAVGLGVDEDELTTEIVPRLTHAAHQQLGRAMEFAIAASRRALAPEDDEGDRLPPDRTLGLRHFADHYADVTGNAPWANPFCARDWDMVDTNAAGLVFRSQLDPKENPEPEKAKGKTPRKRKAS